MHWVAQTKARTGLLDRTLSTRPENALRFFC